MHDGGIAEVTDPSGLFTGGRVRPVAGQAVTVAMEGKRPLMAEVQALVARARLRDRAAARRSPTSTPRASPMILAVLQERCGLRLHDADVFAATVGGMRLREPAADLAIALAIASAFRDEAVPAGLVVLGEVGLAGEVRRVVALDRRLAEAGRLGFSRALVPPGDVRSPKGLAAVEVDDLQGALLRVGLTTAQTV